MSRLLSTSLITSFFLFLFLLAACTMPTADGGNAQSNSANQTAVAQTIAANQTAVSQTSATPEATQDPGDGGSSGGEGSGEDKFDDATFISDVTIPDNSFIEKGAAFTKTWRVKNSGDSTWTTDYKLVFKSGERMGTPETVPIPKEVTPGEIVDLSIEFTAPDTTGEYRSAWLFQNDQGKKFGVGKNSDLPIFVLIFSVEPNQGGSSGGISGGANISGVTLGIDQGVYSGACPVNLTLSWNITTSDAGIVNHTLDLVANTPGFIFDPVSTYSANFSGAGSNDWQYLLILSNSVDATARVSATGANAVLSNVVGISVNCQ
jgi:hypothetical protein